MTKEELLEKLHSMLDNMFLSVSGKYLLGRIIYFLEEE